ncbi:hypothetical protein GCM10009734_33620 [Nonomuraea bangladeshensis]
MPCKSPYPAELRRRAVRIVAGVRPNYPTDWATINPVTPKLNIGTWAWRMSPPGPDRRGSLPGRTTDEAAAPGEHVTAARERDLEGRVLGPGYSAEGAESSLRSPEGFKVSTSSVGHLWRSGTDSVHFMVRFVT